MRAVSLLAPLALLALALAGCRDQEPTAPVPVDRPSFYNSASDYWQVTKLADTNDHICDADCSLREAIEDAASGDEIRFGVTGTIELTAPLQINKNLTITGPGAAQLTVSGAGANGVFSFGTGVAMASLSGLTIADGVSTSGGGILYNSGGTLTIAGCVVSGNRAVTGGGIATYGWGTVSIMESTISGNTATTGNGGGIYAYGTNLTLDRSTISGNTAGGNGGGARFQLGSTSILNSTISGNTASSAGGIYRFQGTTWIILSTITDNNATTVGGGVVLFDGGTHTDVKGSIIWGNTRLGTTADDVGGVGAGYNSLGYNLIGARSGSVNFSAQFNEATDQTGVGDARLGPLQLNGPGSTMTHALLAGSPAIDAGTCTDHEGAAVPTDQRGVTRPQPSGGPCDIGAYELRGGNLGLLTEDVEALGPDGTGTLNKGQMNSLLVTLDVVLNKLASGQNHVAVNNLRAFINEVESLVSDGVLTGEEGQPLIEDAGQIIAEIEAL